MQKMRRVACVSIPRFAAAVERLRLPDDGRPLIVVEGRRVLCACDGAVEAGVRDGDPVREALARCPDATIVPADRARYEEAWERILEALALHAPLVESESWGVAYLDAIGMDALYGGEAVWCQAVRVEVLEASGMEARIGVAGSKFAAWMAAKMCHREEGFAVPEGGDRAFLSPLSVTELPLSVETLRRLALLGIRTVGEFARLPATSVAEQFGPESLEAHRWGKGKDDRPLSGPRRKAVEVHLDFDVPECGREPLLEAMLATGHKALEELGRSGLSVRRIAVEFRLDDGATQVRSAWLADTPGPSQMRPLLEGLLDGLNGDGGGVTEVDLRMTGLHPAAGKQLDLFAHADGRDRLAETLRKASDKHARGCVLRACVVVPDAILVRDRYALEDVTP
jgi:nucleotidyltransferase/DNA polymerase involved in DNA repair